MILFPDGRGSSFHHSADAAGVLQRVSGARDGGRVSDDKPSKSARKRGQLELQSLGEALLRLGKADLDAMPLDDRLREAVIEAGTIQSHSALRRQRQLIGKLMRDADADAIRASLAALGQADRKATRLFHAAEIWRDRICGEGMPAVTGFSTVTGVGTSRLEKLCDELASATSESTRRAICRRIFREVHDSMATMPQAINHTHTERMTE
jgi:ribosome-associated protein